MTLKMENLHCTDTPSLALARCQIKDVRRMALFITDKYKFVQKKEHYVEL
jgi:hypothetical protein